MLGYKEDDILIISLGQIAQHKLSHIIAKAFNKGEFKDNLKLAFVGSCHCNYLEFYNEIKNNENIKYFNHFVSDELYKDYIYAADFAIQLRNSTIGQCSGALSDNISAGLYTISNEDLTKSIEAPNFCIGLKDIPTADDIKKEIEYALESKIYEKDYKTEKDEYIKIHNFDNYTNILLDNL